MLMRLAAVSVLCALGMLSLAASSALALDKHCEASPAGGRHLDPAELGATQACFDAFDTALESTISGIGIQQNLCSSLPATDLSLSGAGQLRSAQSGIQDLEKTAKAKVRYFNAEKKFFRKGTVAGLLDGVVSELGNATTADIAVYTEIENISRAWSGDDCGSAQESLTKAMEARSNAFNVYFHLSIAVDKLRLAAEPPHKKK